MHEVLPGLSIEVVEPPPPADVGYRDTQPARPPTVRVRYEPPRSELLWAIAMIVIAIAALAGFVLWLDARSGVEAAWNDVDLPFVALGAMVLVIFGPVLVLSMRRAKPRFVELADGRLHADDGTAIDPASISTLTTERRFVRYQGADRAVSWIVLARTGRGAQPVMIGLPTREHAERVRETLAQHLPAG